MRPRGFSLVEVLVALVVLEVGLLGVVGTLVLAARTLARAEAEEAGVAHFERVLDSLRAAGGASGPGRIATAEGEVSWSAAAAGRVRLVFSTSVDSALVAVEAVIPSAAPRPP